MPFTGAKGRRYHTDNHFFLFTWKGRGFGKAKVGNLIIDCRTGVAARNGIGGVTEMFNVPTELRLSFYCAHGTVISPHLASPIPLMQGSFEAWEVISGGQMTFNYLLIPRRSFHQLGTPLYQSQGPSNVYKAIVKADRAEKLETGEKRTAQLYDICVPSNVTYLHSLLEEIKTKFSQYLNVHCLFSRDLGVNEQIRHDTYQLPQRFIEGKLGRWEIISMDDEL